MQTKLLSIIREDFDVTGLLLIILKKEGNTMGQYISYL
jgi:hypothetical protein